MSKIKEKLKADHRIKLENFPTNYDNIGSIDLKQEIKKYRQKISKIQDKMYAHNKYSVLISLQGMDTSGKDSLIKEVFKDFNARGVVVSSFKTPSENELEHDYLGAITSTYQREESLVFSTEHITRMY